MLSGLSIYTVICVLMINNWMNGFISSLSLIENIIGPYGSIFGSWLCRCMPINRTQTLSETTL